MKGLDFRRLERLKFKLFWKWIEYRQFLSWLKNKWRMGR